MSSARRIATDIPGICCRANSALMNRSTLSGRAGPWAAALDERRVRSQAALRAARKRRLLDCLTLQFIHQPFHQLLSLDHEVSQLVLLGAGHLALQSRQVVGQEVAKENGFV
jgi:hypothetical protein